MAIVIAFLFPQGETLFHHFHYLGRRGMVIALFLIGANISLSEAKEAGVRSFIYGIILWIVIGVSSFVAFTVV